MALVGGTGCTKPIEKSALSISVDVDAALALNTVRIEVSAMGRTTLIKEFSPVPTPQWEVLVQNLSAKSKLDLNVVARGLDVNNNIILSHFAIARIGLGETVTVNLKLTAQCRPEPMCSADKTCESGICVNKPVFGSSGNTGLDGGLPGQTGDAKDATVDQQGGGGLGAGAAAGGNASANGGAGASGNLPDGAVGGSTLAGSGGANVGGTTNIGVPPGSAETGQPCLAAGDCKSTFCRDSVCCEAACEGKCQACADAYTGMPNGTCAPAKAGTDPHDHCLAAMPETCGDDGTCDGLGACRKFGSNQVCAAAACSGTSFTPTRTCDGMGMCAAATKAECGAFPCTAVGCAKPCGADAECGVQNYCTTGLCKSKKTNGEACAATNECGSGFCVDGVCCQTACTGACSSCSETNTGQKSGSCQPVTAGKDPDAECPVDPAEMCGRDGTCDGKGACRKYDSTTKCSDASCAGTMFTPARTCANGACGVAAAIDCKQALCSADGCRTDCTGDATCLASAYCAAGSCITRKNNGATCTVGNECTSRACVDGVCCETGCAGACYACENSKTNQASGKCAPVTAGTDVDKECADLDKTTCGTNGVCDGAGACGKWPKGTEGAAGMCNAAGNFVSSRTCDGLGTCAAATTDTCAPNICGALGCNRTCTKDADCLGNTYCAAGAMRVCSPEKNQGAGCSAANECVSGSCVDGVCCNNSCAGLCSACSKAKTGGIDGTCAPVSNGQDLDSECTAGTGCGLTGTCNGNGACGFAASGVNCGAASCNTSTNFVTGASTCNGSGTCSAGTAAIACPNRLKCASTSSCITACATDTDCIGSNVNYCSTAGTTKGQCLPKADTGGPCSGGAQCKTGYCVDGFCCGSACNASGGCQGCSAATTGAANGTCAIRSSAAAGSKLCGTACIATASCCTSADCPGAGAGKATCNGGRCGCITGWIGTNCATGTCVGVAAGMDPGGVCSPSLDGTPLGTPSDPLSDVPNCFDGNCDGAGGCAKFGRLDPQNRAKACQRSGFPNEGSFDVPFPGGSSGFPSYCFACPKDACPSNTGTFCRGDADQDGNCDPTHWTYACAPHVCFEYGGYTDVAFCTASTGN